MDYNKNSLKKGWIILPDGLSNEAIIWAKEFGEHLATKDEDNRGGGLGKLTTSQLRKFFGQLKRIQAEGFGSKNKIDLLMLKPQLAYAVGRDMKGGRNQTKIIDFHTEITNAIDVIESKQHFQNFVNLVEAIVAYHKSKGGE